MKLEVSTVHGLQQKVERTRSERVLLGCSASSYCRGLEV
jgi:hypothetical protein